MKDESVGFSPGLYLIVLPKQVRNIKTVVSVMFMRRGRINCVTIHTAKKRKPDLKLLRNKGWVILENKDAGPQQQNFVSLVTHGALETDHEYYEDSGSFRNQEEFFSFLSFHVEIRKETRKSQEFVRIMQEACQQAMRRWTASQTDSGQRVLLKKAPDRSPRY